MSQKTLNLLGLKQINTMIEQRTGERFLTPEVAFLRSLKEVEDLKEMVLILEKPFRLTEGRLLYIRSGCARMRINLREAIALKNQLIVVSPGTVVEFIERDPDLEVVMLAFSNDFMDGWQKEPLLHAFLQGNLFFAIDLKPEDCKRLDDFFTLFWDILHDEPFPREILRSMISVLFRQVESFYHREASTAQRKYSRQEEIFNRFLKLVNQYAVSERNVSFYAGELFLSDRYLSTLIKQTSGRTVMDWVNAAVVQEAKLQLRHTDKLIYQIADDLNFPNPSFFCKFFRHQTGKTPHEYRVED